MVENEKMQFNSSKSRVENIGKRSNKDKRWQGGTGTGSGHLLFGDKRAVRIQELSDLVLRNMFKTQMENAIKNKEIERSDKRNVTADTYSADI